ncbi:UNVERIFIED_CONTAM: hypothetical protein Sradi_4071000 [Sesamum radiatum]|uniref:Uncharacterized protein n=1 Tax=Sesamum radiatum TaxID=300843 RepID=A0AAW2PPE0_SESRA
MNLLSKVKGGGRAPHKKGYMEGEDSMDIDEGQYRNFTATSPEIVEIVEESKSRDGGGSDVYVAVGKNDLHVLKWALDHAVSPEVFFDLYLYCSSWETVKKPVEQRPAAVYIREESNKRKNLLEKYIRLCNESKVVVDTMLVESNASTKAILELIPVANITNLVMGTKQSPFSRLSRKGLGKGEYVKKYAPDYCEVTVVHDDRDRKTKDRQSQTSDQIVPSQEPRATERHFFECVCFSGKFT